VINNKEKTMLWQYRTMLFEFTKDGLLGDKYVDDEEMEKTLNQLGGKGWELVNVTLLQDGVLAFLKKPAQEGRLIEEPMVAAVPDPQPVVPVVRTRAAVVPPPVSTPEPAYESLPGPRSEPQPERTLEPQFGPTLHGPRKAGTAEDVPDLIGGIRIS
jgi:hypothetical protein